MTVFPPISAQSSKASKICLTDSFRIPGLGGGDVQAHERRVNAESDSGVFGNPFHFPACVFVHLVAYALRELAQKFEGPVTDFYRFFQCVHRLQHHDGRARHSYSRH